MNRFSTTALSLFLTCPMVSPVLAQSDVSPTPLGSLYLTLNGPSNSYQYMSWYYPPGVFDLLTIYLVADIDFADIGQAGQNFSNGVTAWEASITVPANMTVLTPIYNPMNAVNIGTSTDYTVGTGSVVLANTLPAPLVTLSVLVLSHRNRVTMEVLPPQGFAPTIPGSAAWIESLTVNGCTNTLTGQPTPCIYRWAAEGDVEFRLEPVEESSWSTVKQNY